MVQIECLYQDDCCEQIDGCFTVSHTRFVFSTVCVQIWQEFSVAFYVIHMMGPVIHSKGESNRCTAA